MKPNIVLPVPAEKELIRDEQFKPYWEQTEEAWWGKFVPYNVRFKHNPNWRNEGFWSLERVKTNPNLFWLIIRYLFWLSPVCLTLYGFSLRFR